MLTKEASQLAKSSKPTTDCLGEIFFEPRHSRNSEQNLDRQLSDLRLTTKNLAHFLWHNNAATSGTSSLKYCKPYQLKMELSNKRKTDSDPAKIRHFQGAEEVKKRQHFLIGEKRQQM